MHLIAAKYILRYLKRTCKLKLNYDAQSKSTDLIGFTDSDWAGPSSTRKSMSACIFGHGTFNENLGAILWQAKGQSTVALSSQEAEYIAASEATQEAIWLCYLNQEIENNSSPVKMYIDNQCALTQIHNRIIKAKSKHISIKFHHAHDEEKAQKTVSFQHVASKENIVDLLRKLCLRLHICTSSASVDYDTTLKHLLGLVRM
jgi:hypothetical protein